MTAAGNSRPGRRSSAGRLRWPAAAQGRDDLGVDVRWCEQGKGRRQTLRDPNAAWIVGDIEGCKDGGINDRHAHEASRTSPDRGHGILDRDTRSPRWCKRGDVVGDANYPGDFGESESIDHKRAQRLPVVRSRRGEGRVNVIWHIA